MNNKQWQIGAVKIDGQAILAPMAGVSDIAYRLLAKEHGAALVCTEMVSAMGIKYKNERTHELLRIEEVERPVSMQIFGSNPEAIALGAKVVADAGADIVDINMGCPVKKVVTSGDGSALMKNPDLAARVAEAAVKAVDVPVTVKCESVGIVIPSMLWTLLSVSNLQVWRLLQYMAVLRSKCTVDMLIGLILRL